MPFTPAHPAIVLPFFKSKRVSATALIAGSMVPDFEFFFQMREVENVGHHWYGILLFDVPVALFFCYVYHNLLRNLLLANFPSFLQNRLSSFTAFSWNSYAANNKLTVIVSLIMGILSHLLLDGLTHYDGFVVEQFQVLSQQLHFFKVQVPVYYFLQVILSLAGLLFVAGFIYKLPVKSSNYKLRAHKNFWLLFVIILLTLLTVRFSLWPQYNTFWSVVMAIMGAVTYTLLLICLAYKTSYLKVESWK